MVENAESLAWNLRSSGNGEGLRVRCSVGRTWADLTDNMLIGYKQVFP